MVASCAPFVRSFSASSRTLFSSRIEHEVQTFSLYRRGAASLVSAYAALAQSEVTAA